MKKNILSLIIMVVVCTAANAQSVIYGGLKGSLNYSLYDKALSNPRGTINQRSGIGYGIGYYEIIELSNKINLQAELNLNIISFSQKDTTVVVNNKAAFEKETFTYGNLELPFMIKYRLTENFAIGAGYQFNLLKSTFRTGKQKTVNTPVTGDEIKTSTELEVDQIPSTQGFIIDASYKNKNWVAGVRLLSANDPLRTVTYIKDGAGSITRKSNLNVALYIGYTIFK